MTVYTETFTGTNGSAAPSPWLKHDFGGASSIQSNAWHMASGGSYNGNTLTYGTVSFTDFDFLVKVKINLGSIAEQYPGIGARMAGGSDGWASPFGEVNNGYIFFLDTLGNSIHIYTSTAGSGGDLVTPVTFVFTAGATYWMRFRGVGTSLQGKVWLDGSGEPGTWGISGTSGTYTSGLVGFRDQAPANTTTSDFDDVTIDDLASSTPVPTFVQTIGSATAQAAGTTLSVTFSGATKPQAGEWIIVRCARDNVLNDPATGDSITTTPGSESYTRTARAQPNATSTAGTGIVGVLFVAKVVATWGAGTNTITWTMPSVTAKAIHVEHWKNIDSVRASSAASAGSGAGAPSVTSGSLTSGDLAVGMAAIEGSGSQAVTADSDTTNGSWITQITPVASGSSTNATTARTFAKVTGQSKLTTGAGTQTYNVTDANTTSVNAVAIIIGLVPTPASSSANLGTASVGITANPLTGPGRNLGTASVAVAANPVSGGFQFGTANVAIAASPMSTSGRTLGLGLIIVTANPLSLSGFPFGAASVGITANPFSGSRVLGLGVVSITANPFTWALSAALGTATVSVSANPLSNQNYSLQAASAAITAFPVGASPGRNLALASVAILAQNLGMGLGLNAANVSIQAFGIGIGLNLPSITVPVVAFPFGSSRTLGTATVGVTAFGMVAQQSQSAALGFASVAVVANALSAAETAPAASVGVQATPMASGRTIPATPDVGVQAFPLGQSRTALLGTATVGVSAYGLSMPGAPSAANLGTANVTVTAFGLGALVLLSAGSAIVGVTAYPLADVQRTESFGSVATQAFAFSQARTLRQALDVAVLAFGLAQDGKRALGLASVQITAYNLGVQGVGTRLGTPRTGMGTDGIDTEEGILQISNGGGVSGLRVGRAFSS